MALSDHPEIKVFPKEMAEARKEGTQVFERHDSMHCGSVYNSEHFHPCLFQILWSCPWVAPVISQFDLGVAPLYLK